MVEDRDNTGDVKPTITLAKVYEDQGLLDEAAEVYRELVALEPEREDIRDALRDIERRLKGEVAEPEELETEAILSQLERWQGSIHSRKESLDQRPERKRGILVVHGPNVEIAMKTERSLSGDAALEQVNAEIKKTAEACGMSAETFQSNDERELVQKISEASDGYDFLIINPGESAHTGTAIRDALSTLDIPIAEVHLSNTCGGDPARQKSLIADVVTAYLAGFGTEGYVMAVRAAANMTHEE